MEDPVARGEVVHHKQLAPNARISSENQLLLKSEVGARAIDALRLYGVDSQLAPLLAVLRELYAQQGGVARSIALDYGLDSATARIVLNRLQRGGWLKRLERGLYLLVPLHAGPQRLWTESALVIDLDYAPGWFLAGLFSQTDAKTQMIFEGETCLRKCHFW